MRKLLRAIKPDFVFKYGLAAILIAVPLYPKFPSFNIPGTYVAIRAEDFLLGALAIFWLAYLFKHKAFDLFKNSFNKALLIFFGVGLLSLLSGLLITKTVDWHIGFLHWARRIEYVIPFFIALVAAKSNGRVRFFGETLFIVSFIAFLYGAGQIYAGLPVISTQNAEYSKGIALVWTPGARLHSTFAGHYDLAAFLALVFPIMFAFLFVIKNWSYRILLFVIIMLPSFWLLARTESRISFIAYLLGVSITLWFIRRKLFILPVIFLSITLMFFVSDLGVKYRYTIDIYKQKVINNNLLNLAPGRVWAQENAVNTLGESSPAPVDEDISTSIRTNVEWPRAIRAFSKNPLLGTGYSSITLATDNDYLRLLGEVGLIGALAFVLVILKVIDGAGQFLRRAKEIDLNTAFVAGFMGSFVATLFNATFIDVFEASKVAIIFWALAGIAVARVRKDEAPNVA